MEILIILLVLVIVLLIVLINRSSASNAARSRLHAEALRRSTGWKAPMRGIAQQMSLRERLSVDGETQYCWDCDLCDDTGAWSSRYIEVERQARSHRCPRLASPP